MSHPGNAAPATPEKASAAPPLVRVLTILADLVEPKSLGANDVARSRAAMACANFFLWLVGDRSPEVLNALPIERHEALQRAKLAEAEPEGEA